MSAIASRTRHDDIGACVLIALFLFLTFFLTV